MLHKDFFNRPTLVVAQELLGKYLVRLRDDVPTALMITDVEAYDGWDDKASHASRGQTPRNTPMFDEPGTIYVYFTYGMHWMLNVVCGARGYPAAILIRGAGDIIGPARLTKSLSIDKDLNGKILGRKNGLWIEDRGLIIPKKKIQKTPRIGVAYAEEYACKPWRYVLQT
jgi:DNA-3-methyladenine glycosylase